jgi:hypothetical protein
LDKLYLVTDDEGHLTYVRHGTPDAPALWRTLGPFAYTSHVQATEAIRGGKLTPQGDDSRLFVREVAPEWFVNEFFEGFHVPTDVFMVDESPIPVTEKGAEWVDRTWEQGLEWVLAFQEDTWMPKVLRVLGAHLGLSEEQLDDMGAIIMARHDAEDEFAKVRRQVMENIKVSITPEPATEIVHEGDLHVIDAQVGTFWLHTNGMAAFDLPELEIRNVPAWWVTAAGAEINGWAGYFMAHPKQATPGAELTGGGPLKMTLTTQVSPDPWWEEDGRACLRIVPEQVFFACEGHAHAVH